MDDSKRKPQGPLFIGGGLGLCAIALILLVLTQGMDLDEQSSRVSFLTIFGLPVGLIIAAVGVAMVVRQRRR